MKIRQIKNKVLYIMSYGDACEYINKTQKQWKNVWYDFYLIL